MKKNIILISIIIISSIIFVSCSKKDPVVEELVEYYNEEFIPIELFRRNETRDFIKEYSEMSTNKNYESEEVYNFYREKSIVIAEHIINQLEKIDLKSDEVKMLNNLFIETQELSLEHTEVTVGNMRGEVSHSDYLKSWNEESKKYDSFYEYLEELMEKYNLEYDEENKVDEFLYKIKK